MQDKSAVQYPKEFICMDLINAFNSSNLYKNIYSY